ncbi:MAG: ABC transporter permease [Chloroflexota bacterium]|nr:ABC transporter permease [Chloroflexota bacterium]
MRLRRVVVLLRKEFLQGPKNFMFVWALVAPILISLTISLAFGSLFSNETTLGIVDQGDSQLVELLDESTVSSREYSSVFALENAVAEGAVDGGLVLPNGFDSAIAMHQEIAVDFYLWGESLAKDRTLLTVTLTNLVRELAGSESPVEIQTITLGDEEAIPWEDRLLPFVVLLTVFVAGIALPGTSLLMEKEKKTIDALVVTPTGLREVFVSKGVLGVIMGTLMGVVILVINQALGSEPGLLIMILFLGSISASLAGLLMAALFDNTVTFFANIKMIGLILYAPVIIYLFPSLPQWIGKIFPTYYIIQPVVEVSQRGGGLMQILPEISVLIALNVGLAALVAFVVTRKKQYAV